MGGTVEQEVDNTAREIAYQLLQRFDRQGIEAEVSYLNQQVRRLVLSSSRINEHMNQETSFFTIRTKRGQNMAFQIRSDLSLKQIYTVSLETLRLLRAGWSTTASFPEIKKLPPLPESYDPVVAAKSEEALSDLGALIIGAVPSEVISNGELTITTWTKFLVNPFGELKEASSQLLLHLCLEGPEDSTNILNLCSRTSDGLRRAALKGIPSACEELRHHRDLDTQETGKHSVVFMPQAVCEILSKLLAPYILAPSFYDRSGFLHNWIGKAVTSMDFSLKDAHALSGAVGAERYDDEGTTTQNTVVIRNGFLFRTLSNRYWASRLGIESTGNASRGVLLKEPIFPVVKTSHLLVEGAPQFQERLDAMIKDKPEIVIVHNTYSTMMDSATGEFVSTTHGLVERAKHGEFQHLKPIKIIGNILSLLEKLSKISVESTQTYVPGGTPYTGPAWLVDENHLEPL